MSPDLSAALPAACCRLVPKLLDTALGPIEIARDPEAEGRPVVAIHGGMGGWDQSALLAQAAFGAAALGGGGEGPLNVLAVSRPGYLGTPMASGPGPAAQADLVAAALDRLGLAGAVVVAVSAGGPSALEFARRHPGRAEGLILVSACTGRLALPRAVRVALPMMRLMARFPRLARGRGPDPQRAMRRAIRDPATRARLKADPEAWALLAGLVRSAGSDLPRRLPGTLADTDTFTRMAPIPVADLRLPVLVVHGRADRIVGFEHGARIAREVPEADLLAIECGEHVAVFTHLDTVRARVAAFLAGLPADAEG